MSLTPLPAPPADTDGVVDWVSRHLGDLASGDRKPSPTRGGQAAADAALDGFDVTGYARRRNGVLPLSARGASRLSPYIRHGLLTLPRVYEHVKSGPASDVEKFRDELLWREYARHLYARMGSATRTSLRFAVQDEYPPGENPWDVQLA